MKIKLNFPANIILGHTTIARIFLAGASNKNMLFFYHSMYNIMCVKSTHSKN